MASERRGVEELNSVFKEQPDVVAVYLIPSEKMDRRPVSERRPSLAVLAKQGLSKQEYLSLRAKILFELSSVLGENNYEVFVLNNVPASIRHLMIKNAKSIYCTSDSQRVLFEETTMIEYLDFHMADKYLGRYGSGL